MLKQIFKSTIGLTKTQYRALCSKSGSNLKDKDIIGEELVEALNNVTNDLHGNDPVEKKKTKLSILGKLKESAKETFDEATGHETLEILHDKEMASLLNCFDAQPESKTRNKFSQTREDTRAVAALRKEIFYEAHQSGMSYEEAHILSEKIVTKAEEKLRQRREDNFKETQNEKQHTIEAEEEVSQKEKEFFKKAYEWMEKNLTTEQDINSYSAANNDQTSIDNSIPNIFNQTLEKFDFFNDVESYKINSLGFWNEWNLRKAKIINENLGPTNKIEQQIEWTKQGKLWPYPINNEYNLGEELNVGFYDHIFLQRYLSKYNLPKTGPIAHFMELVCVGLSKNSYMTVAKKREHLDWFGNFFDSKRQEVIEKLHKQEQLAAANSV